MLTTRAEVYKAIDSERDYQDSLIAKGGSTAVGEHYHSPEEFLVYIDSYLHEAKEKAARTWGPDCKPQVMELVRKIAGLAVACMEHNGAPQRKGFERT